MNIVYCYNTNSKMLSIEAMMKAYKNDYEFFSWKPSICIAERQGGKWNIYYDDSSLEECQKEVKSIFLDKRKLNGIFDSSEKIMNKMRQVTDVYYRKCDTLNTTICEQYIELYSEFLNYYSFSNEFCFKLVEQDILEKLQQYLEDKEANVVLFQSRMNNTYTYQATKILHMFVDEYKKNQSIDENKINEFIKEYQFLFKSIKGGNTKEYIMDSIKDESLIPDRTQLTNKMQEYNELLSKCSPELVEIVNSALKLQNQRLVMREEMVRFNFYFMQLLTKYIKRIYSDYFNDLDIKNVLDMISIDQLFDIQHLDITMLHRARTNTLLFANQELLQANKFNGFEMDGRKKLQLQGSHISLSGQVVCGQGIIVGTIKTMLYNNQKNKDKIDYIYLTKSLHPKDILLSKNIKAIIVDEGGILSHASIIARELGIPCIINTKISSMVLKEGDKVSIDLDQGIVNLLEEKPEDLNVFGELEPLSSLLKDKGLYGNKCVNLCSYFNVFNVIGGYVLTAQYVEKLYKQITYTGTFDMSVDMKNKIRDIFPIIMRSSSIYEDSEKSTAAGLLESVKAIDNFDDFADAIITICDSSKNNSTNRYLEMIGIENEQMPAVLIQKFFDFEVLGVALVENEKATIEYKCRHTKQFEDYIINLNESFEKPNQRSSIINMLVPELLKLKEKDGILVEFGVETGQIYILQIRKYGEKLDV